MSKHQEDLRAELKDMDLDELISSAYEIVSHPEQVSKEEALLYIEIFLQIIN